jgi:hypothetical protein
MFHHQCPQSNRDQQPLLGLPHSVISWQHSSSSLFERLWWCWHLAAFYC